MKSINTWEDEEVKTLFKFVEIKKSEGMPLIKIFKAFGGYTGRCQNSVRNYYYAEIKNLTEDEKRCRDLNIIIKNHVAKNAQPFSDSETKNVVERINTLVGNGYSVRRACLALADGNITKMVRYQNKYRSEIKAKKESKNMGNIIKMPVKRNLMTDDDIKALFMGILKLVKKQEMEKAKQTYECELEQANQKLKNALAEIVVKTAKIEKLQSKIALYEIKEQDNKRKEIEYRIKLAQNSKAKELLKEFINKNVGKAKASKKCV